MQENTGTPLNMKRKNLELLYSALIELKSATRAEIVQWTQISVTTVRSLLEELRQKGDVVELSQDQSTGGRRATRYALNPEANRILALYYLDDTIVYRICTLNGDVLCEGVEHKSVYESTQHLYDLIDACIRQWHVVAIGLGVPGVVENSNYLNRLDLNTWDIHKIGTQIQNTYRLPLVLENDLNAMAAGYAYRAKNSVDMAYVHFNQGCVCAGLIVSGRVLHGASRFAGEFSDMPFDTHRTLIGALMQDSEGVLLPSVIVHTLQILSCVTNPALVVLGGERLQAADPAALRIQIQRCMDSRIPQRMQPEIVLRPAFQDDYLLGLMKLSIEQLVPQIINQYGSDE